MDVCYWLVRLTNLVSTGQGYHVINNIILNVLKFSDTLNLAILHNDEISTYKNYEFCVFI